MFIGQASDSKAEQPGLSACVNKLKNGDTLIVWRLDRSLRNLGNR
ncbi:MAG: recombinase family protein [Chlorobiaceae bacterium]|nr:recombinase family protein [Chlorobiaceae bacterium]